MAPEGSALARCLARRSVVGALLASTASLAAAGPATASVAPFSGDFSRAQRKLTGYVMDNGKIRTARDAWLSDPTKKWGRRLAKITLL